MVAVDFVGGIVRDDVEVVAGGDVVAGCVAAVGDDLGVEARLEVGLVDEERIASAHVVVLVG